MNPEFFIASRIIKGDKKNQNISKPIVKIAIFGIALGLAVMIIAIAIVIGFKQQIRNKVVGFSAPILIQNFDSNNSLEPIPIDKNQPFLSVLKGMQGINHIQTYTIKTGIIKTSEEMEGVVVKGIGKDFDWNFFNDKLIEGKIISLSDTAKSNEIIVSKKIAEKLKLKLGDDLLMYFIQQPPRMRKFTIVGIYQTGLEQFDERFVLADIAHIQKLNDWTENQIAGFEISLNNYDDMDDIAEQIQNEIPFDLRAKTIREANPQIFDWLDLQDVNVQIILILMVLVSGINMIATLLILILEKTNTIGILKTLGMQNFSIQKIFLFNAAYIIGRGMFWGNLIGLSLCFIQLKFGIFKLNEANYYLSQIPINLNLWWILLLNIGILFICVLMLVIPSYIISKISPVKAIRFN